ncbi:MAG TPA: glycosyltransferase [Candidatus Bathyarchaeia archaeon]|nr:glycosyltransferase [Candidatus Bathyarchaeia archaeon]
MRIALFSHFYFPTVNGVVTAMENLRRGLTQLGHDVYVFAPKARNYLYPSDCKIVNFPSINIRAKGVFLPLPITFSPKIFKMIKEANFDIIHTQHPFYVGESAHFYAKRFNIPLIFTFHTQYDRYTLSYLPFLPEEITLRTVNKYLQDFVSRCNGIIIPTKEIKRSYFKNLKSNFEIIPSGIDIAKFRGKTKIDRKKFSISENQIILLTAGRVAKEKNIEFLIKAFKLIQMRNSRVILFIVGDGPAKKDLEKSVYKLKLEDKIIFTGEMPYQEMPNYFQMADIFVYTCITDVQPQILVEASAAGLPIIAIDSPDKKFIIKNGYNGILVPNKTELFANEVLKIITDTELRKNLSSNALKAVQKFSYLESARKIVRFYRQISKSYS